MLVVFGNADIIQRRHPQRSDSLLCVDASAERNRLLEIRPVVVVDPSSEMGLQILSANRGITLGACHLLQLALTVGKPYAGA